MMSRKDYVRIANTLVSWRVITKPDKLKYELLAEFFAADLSNDNPAFDKDRFNIACGL